MGTLETLRDETRDNVASLRQTDTLLAEAICAWVNEGCPGYDPAPWTDPGTVPTEPGRYDVWAPGMERPRVWELLPAGVWTNGSGHIAGSGFPPDARFRWLAPPPVAPGEMT